MRIFKNKRSVVPSITDRSAIEQAVGASVLSKQLTIVITETDSDTYRLYWVFRSTDLVDEAILGPGRARLVTLVEHDFQTRDEAQYYAYALFFLKGDEACEIDD